jgi:NAD(P)-dependent dehydrogenase (short-subunit alcohol dehydrogenase family)
MMSQRLSGKTVLLTGALGSLGRAQAWKLAEHGASLLLLDKPGMDGGVALAEAISRTGPPAARFIPQDLSDPEAAARLVSSLARETGGIDILINNAAVIVNTPVSAVSLADFEEQMRVNATAAFALCQAVTPGMAAKSYGKIVNFCSLTLNGRWQGYVPYVASKGAMLGLTKSLARDLGRSGIRVNAVSPGAVISEAEERVFGERLAEYNDWVLENQCLKQRIMPADVAGLVLFLVSPESDMMTGQNLGIDGGW